MDFVTGNIGWIEAICGPMFSGKSEELMRRLRRAMIARKRVQVFKPIIDNRYSADEIVSHTDIRMKSEAIGNVSEIMQRLDRRTQVVGLDEANFFGQELVEIATQLADGGKQVIVGGLDTDYMGRPFPPMPDCSRWLSPSPRRWPSACAAATRPSTPSDWWSPTTSSWWAPLECTKRVAGDVLSPAYQSRN